MTIIRNSALWEDPVDQDATLLEPMLENDETSTCGLFASSRFADARQVTAEPLGVGTQRPGPDPSLPVCPLSATHVLPSDWEWGASLRTPSFWHAAKQEDRTEIDFGETLDWVRSWLTVEAGTDLDLQQQLVARYGRFHAVSGIRVTESTQSVTVYVLLDHLQYDDELMDGLLGEEWAILEQFPDSRLHVIYLPLRSGDPPLPIPAEAMRILG